MSRRSATTTRSPYNLFQERFRDDPWRLLLGCIMVNCARASVTIPILEQVLLRWPSPESLAGAQMGELSESIRQAGFQNRRAQRMIQMSQAWLTFDGGDASSLPGIGRYGKDSYDIFVLGIPKGPEDVLDKELKNYLKWLEQRADRGRPG